MDEKVALIGAKQILKLAKIDAELSYNNFLEYASTVADAAKDLTQRQRGYLGFDFKEWAVAWRQLYDNFDKEVERDPMLLYVPAHSVAEDFHRSNAYIRYFRAGNRTSKTQSGYVEHYFVATGQNPYKAVPGGVLSTFIVAGLPFAQYQTGVFEKKFLTGEDYNPISPIFPVGGKWFYHYDERAHKITIACKECANAGKAGSCSHPKRTITLFSGENSWEVLQGASYYLGHFDEHVDESFFAEARQRTKTTGGSLIVTGTPLHGFEAWEHRHLTRIFESGPPLNRVDPDDPASPPLVSLHQIDQYSAGLVPHSAIKSEVNLMDEFEVRARVYGEPAPLAKNPVFDRRSLEKLQSKCRDPERGNLALKTAKAFSDVLPEDPILFNRKSDGELRIWEHPVEKAVYLCAVDTAAGLMERSDRAAGDASCACILKATTSGSGVALEMVAQWHGWKTPYEYANELFLLGTYYNSALMVVELTGGLGMAVMQRLRNDHAYWNLYREVSDATEAGMRVEQKLGVETNIRTKPFMVAALKQFIRDERIAIYDKATIGELVAFEQEITGKGGVTLSQPRYRGAGGAHDDRVMALAIGAATALSYSPLLAEITYSAAQATKKPLTAWDKALAQELAENKNVDF